MGWAKYLEDIISRQNGTSRVRAEIKQVGERGEKPKISPRKLEQES